MSGSESAHPLPWRVKTESTDEGTAFAQVVDANGNPVLLGPDTLGRMIKALEACRLLEVAARIKRTAREEVKAGEPPAGLRGTVSAYLLLVDAATDAAREALGMGG